MSETPAETPATPTENPAPKPEAPKTEQPDTGGKDYEAEASKWKALARKHEEQSKANADKARRFDELEESQKTELEKAADRAAKAEAKAAELQAAVLRSEVAEVKKVPAALLKGSTREELEAHADELLAFKGQVPPPDFGGGDRGGDVVSKAGQLSKADMKRMTPAEIEQAHNEGRFADLLKPS